MTNPRIELGTFRVLGECHNQLDHEDACKFSLKPVLINCSQMAEDFERRFRDAGARNSRLQEENVMMQDSIKVGLYHSCRRYVFVSQLIGPCRLGNADSSQDCLNSHHCCSIYNKFPTGCSSVPFYGCQKPCAILVGRWWLPHHDSGLSISCCADNAGYNPRAGTGINTSQGRQHSR